MMKTRMKPLTIAILIVLVLPPLMRTATVAAANPPAEVAVAIEHLDLVVGRSTIIRTERPITRVSLSTSDIADAMVTTPNELLVHGKTPGTISLLVWGDNGRITTYDVSVRRDLTALEAQVRRLFPSEPITVASNGKDVVLSGVVSSKYVVDRASSLAVGYVDKADNVVNLLRQQEGVATNQVMLKVRFAEVSRSAMQELGASFFTGPNGKGDWIGRSTTQQYPAPIFDKDKGLVFSDFLNLFAFNTEEQLGAVVTALKGKGLFQSLAEPNLITTDGIEASFLAGGEYPYPVVQGTGATAAITIVFKEFGIRLRFTPTVTSQDLITLKVNPEVSTLDFTNAVILQGFRVPALSTRRTETQVELRDGQTFAIAGLIDHNVNETLRRVPGIGDIPILGYLFRSQAFQKNATELVVMITPHIVRRDSPGVTPNLPGLVEPFLADPNRRIPPPVPAFTSPVSQQAPAAMPTAFAAPAAAPSSGASAPAQQTRAAADKPVRSAEPEGTVGFVDSKRAAQDEKQAVQQSAELATKIQKQQAKAQLEQQKQDEIAARKEEERARAAAKIEARRAAAQAAEDLEAANLAHKAEDERQKNERKLSEKRAVEQAAIDRKRWAEQQQQAAVAKEQAAQAKAVGDKLAKEQARRDGEAMKIEAARLEEEMKVAEKHRKAQEKLAKEQASREDELARLISQYRKLTQAQEPQNGQDTQQAR